MLDELDKVAVIVVDRGGDLSFLVEPVKPSAMRAALAVSNR